MKTTKILFIFLLIQLFTFVVFGELPNQPGDPGGISTPIDGGILMALLAGGGLVTMLIKKKKDKE